MSELIPEILDQILIRLNVKDLIRCRSVSKSWKSLIDDPVFIKAHLQNVNLGNRRIVMSAMLWGSRPYDSDRIYSLPRTRYLLGSSNGLVCVSTSPLEFLIINPETREVIKLKKPQVVPEGVYMVFGFGYDSSKDDYKVVLGFTEFSNRTRFLSFSLKSNIWKFIGDVNYMFISRVGVLYNGALKWLAYHGLPDIRHKVVVSFDLSKEKFEIPLPCQQCVTRLGTMDGCLCVFHCNKLPFNVWVMNECNGRQSWELVGPEYNFKSEVVHHLKDLKYYMPNRRSLCHKESVMHTPEFIGAPLYTPSLVSPHVCRLPNRKRQATSITKSHKVPKHYRVTDSSSETGNLESLAVRI